MKQSLQFSLSQINVKQFVFAVKSVIGLFFTFHINTSIASPPLNEATVGLAFTTEIYYVGPITPEGTDKFEVLFSKHKPDLTTLIINSTGGEVFAGLRLGNLVRENQLKVRVKENCSSACANYVLPASRSVFVEAGAIIGWHGGALQSLYEPFPFETSIGTSPTQAQKNMLAEYVKNWRAAELQFFENTGVNQAVTILGMLPGLNSKRDSALFSYDPKTLAALGLHITFETEPSEHSANGRKVVQTLKMTAKDLQFWLQLHEQILLAQTSPTYDVITIH